MASSKCSTFIDKCFFISLEGWEKCCGNIYGAVMGFALCMMCCFPCLLPFIIYDRCCKKDEEGHRHHDEENPPEQQHASPYVALDPAPPGVVACLGDGGGAGA